MTRKVKKVSESTLLLTLVAKLMGIFPAWKYSKPYRLFQYRHYIDVFIKNLPKDSKFHIQCSIEKYQSLYFEEN